MVRAKSAPKPFRQAYFEELPRVASSLTSAAILFGAAVLFQPSIKRLFSTPATDYPIICTADPVALDVTHQQAQGAFFIVNRGPDELGSKELQQKLATALGRKDSSFGPVISIPFGPYDGNFVSAGPDLAFNGDKGALRVSMTANRITIQIDQIKAGAILKVDIVWAQSPLPSADVFTRETKAALPFGRRDYESACYSA